ncbi:MAG: DUF1257 domain-containing protein [Synechococcales cyanobacterium RM1_1_8]|nr:DUF1257 domain-containing protein [Synechococcales cyanobacterium RM1_1_8]
MSHFSSIKTQIRDLNALQQALSDLQVDWKSGPHPVRGYQGDSRTAEVVIEQENGYDVGFGWNGQEYELVADLQYWQQPLTVNRFLSQVTQRYAINSVLSSTADQGFQVAEQVSNQDGTVRLVVQRWNG